MPEPKMCMAVETSNLGAAMSVMSPWQLNAKSSAADLRAAVWEEETERTLAQ
jgi:hypothetical protein